MRRTISPLATALTVATLLILAVAGQPAGAGGEPLEPTPSSRGGALAVDTDPPAVEPAAASAMARERGISVKEATRRLAGERELGDRGSRLEKALAGRSGGSYLDANGNLVVTTLDAAGDAAVVRAGGRAKRVDDTSARLDDIMRQLDRQAAKRGAGAVQGWYVDIPTNTVVVTVSEGAADAKTRAMLKRAATFGASVRIERVPADQAPKATEWMVGGFEYRPPSGGTCSVGFNTVDAAGRNVVLTAGHCIRTAGTVSRNGYNIGAVRTTNYPGDDFGTFWNSYPGYWRPSPSVYRYNGTYMSVRGQWNAPPVGATVCKSGRTTGFTCGRITAHNIRVQYRDGSIISGLVQHNACVEPGDSGGANISAGGFALGITSGSNHDPVTKKCQSKFGRADVSYYQPIGEALSRNGLRLLFVP